MSVFSDHTHPLHSPFPSLVTSLFFLFSAARGFGFGFGFGFVELVAFELLAMSFASVKQEVSNVITR